MPLRKFTIPLFLCLTLIACDSAEDKAQAHYERGLELLSEGDEARARVEFRNAIREVGTFVEPRLELARISVKNGSTRSAYVNYLRVAEQVPDNLEARIALGEMAFVGKQWDDFEAHTREAVRLAPQDPAVTILSTALRYRDAVLEEDSAQRAAILIEAQAKAEDAEDSEILRQILIDGYISQQNFSAALRELDRAIEADPENLELYRVKVQLLAQLGDEDGIEDTLRQMVILQPEDEETLSNLIQYMVSRDRLTEVEDFLRERVAEAPEGDETMMVNLVQFQLRLIGVNQAVEELDAAIAKNPDAYILRTLRASLDYDIGKRDEAIAELESILETAESELDLDDRENIKITLATMLSRDGNEVGARRLVEEILNENPNAVGALKIQARWMIAADDTDGAITAMRTALAASPEDSEAMTIMAEAYQRAGNPDLMRNFLSLAVEASGNAPEQSLRYAVALRQDDKTEQAEAILISALRVRPGNLAVLRTLGDIYIELRDLPRARQVIDTLRRIDTEDAKTAAADVELALVALEAGSDQALQYLEDLATQSDGDVGINLALVRARLQNGDVEGALGIVNDMAAANPTNDTVAYVHAITLLASGDLDTARSELTALVERAPSAVPAWLQLARISGPSEQLATLDAAIAANPTSVELLWAKASFLQQDGDIDGAIGIYEDLYEQNSGSVIIANNLASLLATFRRDEESLARARLISRRLQDTDIPALQDTYGWIQHRSGNSEEALSYLEPAAAGLPNDPTVQYHLGAVYKALGRPQEALSQMRKAIDLLGPLGSTDLADEIRSEIAALEMSSDQ